VVGRQPENAGSDRLGHNAANVKQSFGQGLEPGIAVGPADRIDQSIGLFQRQGALFHESVPPRFESAPLPGFRPSGLTVTTDRAIALTREDLGFLTGDHPLVGGAMDLFLGSGQGNVAFAHWTAPGTPAFLLDMVFLLEAPAPPDLVVERFLPPVPIRVTVDHRLEERSEDLPDGLSGLLTEGSSTLFAKTLPAVSHRIADMVEAGRAMARDRALPLVEAARREAALAMDEAIGRLEILGRVNAAIGDRDMDAARKEKDAVLAAVSTAEVRLDAMCLIVKGPADG
jgi:ATP-dependent helicase HepA